MKETFIKDSLNIFFPQLPAWSSFIITICVILVLAAVGMFIAQYFTASRKFKSILLSELKGLYPTPSNWPENEFSIDDILREKFPTLEAAVTEFSDVLPFFAKTYFLKAWIKYYAEYGEEYGQSYHQYMPLSCPEVINYGVKSSFDTTKTYKSDFKKHLDHLLSFAKII
ncbi:MAG: hypothetical protein J7K65_05730 [Planctomycetes bacterium]|nr:hypothetical protein [Planctomycetota bacterium]